MQQPPDHHDADLLLRLYELRREEKLRKAREWFLREFHAETVEELMKRYPFGSIENDYYRMVVSYWDMAASFLNHGLLHEDLFFENTGELSAVWNKIKHLVPQSRETWKNPMAYKNLEQTAEKYEKWMEKRSPGALAVMRERMAAVAKTR